MARYLYMSPGTFMHALVPPRDPKTCRPAFRTCKLRQRSGRRRLAEPDRLPLSERDRTKIGSTHIGSAKWCRTPARKPARSGSQYTARQVIACVRDNKAPGRKRLRVPRSAVLEKGPAAPNSLKTRALACWRTLRYMARLWTNPPPR